MLAQPEGVATQSEAGAQRRSGIASATLAQLRRIRLGAWLGPAWLWVILVAMLAYGFYFIPEFFAWENLTGVMRQGIPLAIVAIGQTLVILTGGIDISVAVVMSMADTLAMGLMKGHESGVPLAIVLPILAGAFVGLANGITVQAARVPAFIVTLGSASILQGIVFAYTNYNTYGTPAESVANLGYAEVAGVPTLVWLFAPVVVVALILQNRTRAARHLYAVGGDEGSARRAGIATARVKIGAYVACSALAALAGVVLTTRTGGGEPLAGVGFDWDSIAAVVIGGTLLKGGKGGIAGTMVAVLLLSLLNDMMNLDSISSFWQSLVKGLIVLVAVGGAAVVALRPLEVLRARRAQIPEVGA